MKLVQLLGLFAAGCVAVGPDYEAPEREIPAQWREQDAVLVAGTPAELAAWWRQLGDPLLDDLVLRAVSGGLDLREALARVREARSLRGVAEADLWPKLDAQASYRRTGDSENTPFGDFATDWHRFAAGFELSWELDVWGRVRRSVEAAEADVAASVEDARGVAVSVAAETARSYVELRTFQRRLAIARQNVDLQGQTLELVRGRFEAGLVGERDVAQARTNVETTRARVPALEAGVRAAENRLAVLLGAAPGALAAELAELQPIPVPPAQVAVGLPADLLRRRPDVRRAERFLAAETARIGVAEGDLYPRLSLLGTLGLESDDASDFFDPTSGVYTFGPSLRWNLFDAGSIRGRIEAQEARTEQALLQWERTVLTALEETENAMTSFVREQVRRGSLVAAVENARRSVELAQAQYREGISDFQTVLDSERTLAELEDDLAVSDAAVTTNLVTLFRALGGGWEQADRLARAIGE